MLDLMTLTEWQWTDGPSFRDYFAYCFISLSSST